ncbi:hypothetical protein ILYODFUR_030051 [Ilyodon furcidens]|uniref:Uncharacterized protein n=1 Tax=Ilyodon furcidens TaxID=33524 RepID=A0ABV0T552_9TELE
MACGGRGPALAQDRRESLVGLQPVFRVLAVLVLPGTVHWCVLVGLLLLLFLLFFQFVTVVCVSLVSPASLALSLLSHNLCLLLFLPVVACPICCLNLVQPVLLSQIQ